MSPLVLGPGDIAMTPNLLRDSLSLILERCIQSAVTTSLVGDTISEESNYTPYSIQSPSSTMAFSLGVTRVPILRSLFFEGDSL